MSGLRVIAGSAKGRRLQRVPGDSTRPVMDRVKEALFNILGPSIVGANFLDLFAGTGGVGIEALSRGAARAVFLDTNRQAIATIHANLQRTELAGRALVLKQDAFDFVRNPEADHFDFVYVAPPQYQRLWLQCLNQLDEMPHPLNPDAWVIAQIDPKEFEEVELRQLVLFDRRRYGSTELLFLEYGGG